MSSPTQVFSTTLKDGEALVKINSWLCQFRADELLEFHAERISADQIKIFLEAHNHKRLKILATNPPHQGYCQKDKSIPFIWITFTEPIDLESFQGGNTTLNGIAIADGKMSLEDNDFTLKIDTSSAGDLFASGIYEIIFSENVRHRNKIWRLYGERKLIWTTSDHPSTRGGVDVEDPDRTLLEMSRISVERQHSESYIYKQFLDRFNIPPSKIVKTKLISGYPEYDRTTMLVIHKKGPKIPYVLCANPEYKSSQFMDGSPDPFNVRIGFSQPVDSDSLSGNIYFDNVPVPDIDWTLTQNSKLLTLNVTPSSEYKHHMVKLASFKSVDYTRENPYMWAFTMHYYTSAGAGSSVSELDDLDDVIITSPNSGETIVYNGSEWVNQPIGISDLNDTAITSPSNNDVLTWNGSNWVNQAPSGGGSSPSYRTISIAHAHNDAMDSFSNSANLGYIGDISVVEYSDTLDEQWITLHEYPLDITTSGGTMKIDLYHSANDATSPRYALQFRRYNSGFDMSATSSWSTESVINDAVTGGYNLKISTVTVADDDSIVPGDLFSVRVRRDGSHGDDGSGPSAVYMMRVWMDYT